VLSTQPSFITNDLIDNAIRAAKGVNPVKLTFKDIAYEV